MSFRKYLNYLKNISIIKTIYYNYFCSHIHRKKAHILVFKKSILHFEKKAKLYINNGVFQFGRCLGCRDYSNLRVQEYGKISVNGSSIIEYGADILVKKSAVLTLGNNSYINSKVLIRCHEQISIGEDGFFATGVEVRDNDGHKLFGSNNSAPVLIGNHVWICSNVEILKGVRIGDGSMVGAYALVTRSIPEKSLAYGVPARVHKQNIVWE